MMFPINATISLIKKNTNEKIEGIKAHVQTANIYYMGSSPLFEVGDKIERSLSNGSTEYYEIIDPCFMEGSGITEHYQMKVKKIFL